MHFLLSLLCPCRRQGTCDQKGGDKFNLAELASGTCKLARNELCYIILATYLGISKGKQNNQGGERRDNWGLRHADLLMRGLVWVGALQERCLVFGFFPLVILILLCDLLTPFKKGGRRTNTILSTTNENPECFSAYI